MFTASALQEHGPEPRGGRGGLGRLGLHDDLHRHLPADRAGHPGGLAAVLRGDAGHLRRAGGAGRAGQHQRAHHLHLQAHRLEPAALQHRRRRRDPADGRHRDPGVGAAARAVGKSFATVAGKAFRPRSLNLGPWRWFTFGLAITYLFVVVVLPTLALVIAAFRKFLFFKDFNALFDMKPVQLGALQQRVRQSADHAVDLEHAEGRRDHRAGRRRAGLRHRLHRQPHPRRRPPHRSTCLSTLPVAIPGLVVGVAYLWAWIGLPGGLYGTIWILALAFVARFMPGHGEGAVDLVPADPQGARGSRLDLRPRHARHHPHHRAAAGPARRGGLDDAAVRAGDPRAGIVALPLHQRHHRDGRAAARLLRGRQHRQDRRLQPGADGDPRRACSASRPGSRATPRRAAPASADQQRHQEETDEETHDHQDGRPRHGRRHGWRPAGAGAAGRSSAPRS